MVRWLSKFLSALFLGFAILPLVWYIPKIFHFPFSTIDWRLIVRSLTFSFSVAFSSVCLAIFLAWITFKGKVSPFFKLILIFPLFVSPFIYTVAISDFFDILKLHNFSYFQAFIVQVFLFTPIAILIIGNAFLEVPQSAEEASLIFLGSKKIFIKIFLPSVNPAIFTSFILIFIFSFSDFVVSSYFNLPLLSTDIFINFTAFYKYDFAFLMSLFMAFFSIFLLLWEGKFLINENLFGVGIKNNVVKKYEISLVSKIFLLTYVFLSVALPIFLIFGKNLYSSEAIFSSVSLLRKSIVNSLLLGISVGFLTVFFSIVIAYNSVFLKDRFSKFLSYFLLIVFALPSISFGINLIKFYNNPLFYFIYKSFWILIIALVSKNLFLAFKIIESGMKTIEKSIWEQAKILGLKDFFILRKILIPQILTSVFVAFVVVVIFTISELSLSIMLYQPGMELLGIKIFTLMPNSPNKVVYAMIFINLMLNLMILFLSLWGFSKLKKYEANQ